MCHTCKSNEQNINEGPKIGSSENPAFDDHKIKSTSTSIVQHNIMTFTVSQIGTIFGNLPYEPLAIPVNMVHGDYNQSSSSQENVKEEHCEIGFHDQFYCGSTCLKTSTSIRINQEYELILILFVTILCNADCQHTFYESKNLSIWDPNKVFRKRRSKLPQYTLSPIARILKQLHHVYRSKLSTLNRVEAYDLREKRAPKYDDVLIYEKCKHVAENEIGIGAKLLSSSPPFTSSRKERLYKPRYALAYSTTSSSSNESGYSYYSNCLIDVPITSSPSK
ncbi:ubiquitin-specific protease 12 [Striga asiatica]|uniref:Ubiquitin-specific protease 12 n=1 Tax=Striga asiatica TaxID=4170 RepID=A0A5A7Q9U6_STRAF|nr:ubiquitin-specific protease 12 [Striga asiatica]